MGLYSRAGFHNIIHSHLLLERVLDSGLSLHSLRLPNEEDGALLRTPSSDREPTVRQISAALHHKEKQSRAQGCLRGKVGQVGSRRGPAAPLLQTESVFFFSQD